MNKGFGCRVMDILHEALRRWTMLFGNSAVGSVWSWCGLIMRVWAA